MNNEGPLSSGSFIFIFAEVKKKSAFLLFIPAVIWLIIATVLLLMPGPDVPQISFLDEIYFDKWVHAGLFGCMTILFCFPFIKMQKATTGLIILIAALCISYGIAMEYAQEYWAFERDFDYFDMMADAAGGVLGCFFSVYLLKKYKLRYIKNKPL